jgi:DNA polymerase-4
VRDSASILHVDLDAFYASVEQLLDPTLRGRPVVVGGLGRRGVVAAASYEARPYGVQSAMPMAHARRACPHAVFLAPRFSEYERFSAQVMEILRSVTPLVEPISLDEAFLDVAGARRRLGDGPTIARFAREQIKHDTGLVASVGVATTKFLAKIASDLSKPDGLLVVEPGTEDTFLHPLPLGRLWGVGPATLARLESLGARTVGDVARLPEETLATALGHAHGSHLAQLARNLDPRDVTPDHATKSIGNEETFPHDVRSRLDLEREILRLADRVAGRLRHAGLEARTIMLKVRFADFRTITRSRTEPEPTALSSDITTIARGLLALVDVTPGVRLLGVSASQLVPMSEHQGVLDLGIDDTHDVRARRVALEDAMDAVRARFGADAVGAGSLVEHSPPQNSPGQNPRDQGPPQQNRPGDRPPGVGSTRHTVLARQDGDG